MLTTMRPSSPISRPHAPRGFVLVTALGALVVLMALAFMAAGSAQHTFLMSVDRQRDRRLTDSIQSVTPLLSPMAGSSAAVSDSVRTIQILSFDGTRPDSMEVTATFGVKPDQTLLQGPIRLLDGDELAQVSARRFDGAGGSRRATFLINSRGLRQAPILIREERL
jgi:hypothetical protein